MPRWRVDFFGKVLSTLGSVEAPDEKSAIAEAAREFNITRARRNKLVVTKVIVPDRDSNKSPDLSQG
jgi:hypothetical protein